MNSNPLWLDYVGLVLNDPEVFDPLSSPTKRGDHDAEM